MIKPNWDISNYTKHSISEIQNFGVYAIMGKLNDDVLYIGSTKATSNLKTGHHKIGFAKRWGKHIDIFRHGGRSNLNLLAYINNDPSKIYFIILEVVDYNIKEDILLQKEDYWISELSPKFNIITNNSNPIERLKQWQNCSAKAKRKGVNQYTLHGQFIKKYASMREAQRQTGCDYGSINRVCMGKLKQTGGYIFRLTKNELVNSELSNEYICFIQNKYSKKWKDAIIELGLSLKRNS